MCVTKIFSLYLIYYSKNTFLQNVNVLNNIYKIVHYVKTYKNTFHLQLTEKNNHRSSTKIKLGIKKKTYKLKIFTFYLILTSHATL